MELEQKYRPLLGSIGFLSAFNGLAGAAERIFDGLSASAPDKLPPLIGKACSMLAAKQVDEAIAVLEKQVLAKDPTELEAKCFLGLAYHQKKDAVKAKQILNGVIAEAKAGSAPAKMAKEVLGRIG